tara:strand:- start:82 stop:321 length:240 start_codon:yes stop_codon:yes gene_type:complete
MITLTFEEVILDPEHYFETPHDILHYPGFNGVEKRKILKAWALDVTLLQVCDEENMSAATEPRLLSRIHQAIHQIETGL